MIMEYLEELVKAQEELFIQFRIIEKAADVIRGSKLVLTMGNGGSSSTAQHLAQGLCDAGIKAICLTDNVSLLTALSNDEGYGEALEWVVRLFSESQKGITVVGISASGDSPNIINAIVEAKRLKAKTIGLLGFGGGEAKSLVNLPVILSSKDYGIVEDVHLSISHIICRLV